MAFNRLKKALVIAALLFTPLVAFAIPSSVDRTVDHIQPLISTDYIKGLYFTATSTSKASTFPFASTTVTSASTLCLSTDCRSVWPVGGVSSVFGRTGAVTAQSGDYTTAQVTESGNLYFTNTRAQNAITLTTTGSSGAASYLGGVLNIPNYTFTDTVGNWFAPVSYGNATSTTLGFLNGFTSPASSTIAGSFHLGLGNGGLGVFGGLVSSGATTTAGTGLTYTGNAFNVNTTQNITTLSNLTSGTVNSASGVLYNTATSSITNGTGISFTGTAGALIGGSSLTITNSGVTSLAVTSPITTSGSTGSITVGCASCLTANQTITLSGAVTGSGTTAITTAFGTAAANTILVNGSGITAIPTFNATSTLFTGSTGQVGYFASTGGFVGTSTLFISTAGNVGIGTTTFADASNVFNILSFQKNIDGNAQVTYSNYSSGSNAQDVMRFQNDVGPAQLGFTSSGLSVGVLATSSIYLLNNTTGGVTLVANNASGAVKFAAGGITEQMRLTPAGLFGIGTTSPSQTLDVNGNINLEGPANGIVMHDSVTATCYLLHVVSGVVTATVHACQ